MCTAVYYKTKDCYFGRNLDLEYSYHEEIAVMPRNYPLKFKHGKNAGTHYAIIGTAFIQDNYPLFYDAVNEKGLGIAGLNFLNNAVYSDCLKTKENLATYEFIIYILSFCSTVSEAEELLKNINLTNENFSEKLPASSLHWMIADKEKAITVECVKDGLKVYKNPYGILTNNPPFEWHVENLNNYSNLKPQEPKYLFKDNPESFCVGMGSSGLPGDLSSPSRFVRAFFTKESSVSDFDENSSVSQFFHILSSVEMVRGAVRLEKGEDMTVYSSCANLNRGIYYYKTYNNHTITSVNMYNENLDGEKLVHYPMIDKLNIFYQN